jgi:hypothetical protein
VPTIVFHRHEPPNINRRGKNYSEEKHLLFLEGGSDTGGKISNDADSRVNFLLCPSCFWCASCLSSQMLSAMAAAKDSASPANCPSCVAAKIESIPGVEEYKFDYDTERGVTMELFR